MDPQKNTSASTITGSLNWICTGKEHPETVLLLHAVGYDLTYWDRQIEVLQTKYNVVALDLPGHGRSLDVSEDFSFSGTAKLIANLIEAAIKQPIHLVGLSYGSMVAQTLVLERPELVRSLTLLGTASTFAEAARTAMRTRAETIRTGGMSAVLKSSLERWFTPETIARRPDIIDRVSKTILTNEPLIQAAIWETISDLELHERLKEIKCPTLLLVGEHDASTPPSSAAAMAKEILDAQTVIIDNAAHIISVEAPFEVNAELLKFLSSI